MLSKKSHTFSYYLFLLTKTYSKKKNAFDGKYIKKVPDKKKFIKKKQKNQPK